MFDKFIEDKDAFSMYITGAAGTGKTTLLVELLDKAKSKGLKPLICAYTHKACKVIADTVGSGHRISTLHSFLKKRPGINVEATKKSELDFNYSGGAEDIPKILFLDEFSMIGADDLKDIIFHQDTNYDGIPTMKVVYIGDMNQLPPIKEEPAVVPQKPYWMKLTKVYRQSGDNELKDTLSKLVGYIEGEDAEPLEANNNFIRGIDIVDHIDDIKQENNICLCYTNKAVQHWNNVIQGRDHIKKGDTVFCPTNRKTYIYKHGLQPELISHINKCSGEMLPIGSKFKTLEYLIANTENFGVQWGAFENDEGGIEHLAFAFGHYTHKMLLESLQNKAMKSNKAIYKVTQDIRTWVKSHSTHKLARSRAKGWRDFLCVNESVMCIDFSHAMTVHKSQGSTYDNVFIDIKDLDIAKKNYDMYLRLMYVALSRAKYKVYANV